MGLGMITVQQAAKTLITQGLKQGMESSYGINNTDLGSSMAEKFADTIGEDFEKATENFFKEGQIVGTVTYTGGCTAGAASGTLIYSGTELSMS